MSKPTPDTNTLLTERGRTHGNFTDHARVTQRLKAVLEAELRRCKPELNGALSRDRASIDPDDLLNATMLESLDMILHKIGRIVAGNARHEDHWADIAGYARLVSERLERNPTDGH